MSPIRCSDCEKNVALEIEEAEVLDYTFDGESSVEVEIHMAFVCAECGSTLTDYTGTSTEVVDGLEEYLEAHEDLDSGDAELDEPEIESRIIRRDGRKTYLAKWTAPLKLGQKVFKVKGELAVTQDQMEKVV